MKFKKINKVSIACFADSQQTPFCDKKKCAAKCRFEELFKEKMKTDLAV